MLLAIDTSSGTSVAVVDRDGGVLAERTEVDTRRHAEVIGTLIAECLEAAGVAPSDLSAVVAGMGPGPFTGLRVGIAAARAFAFGAGKPCLPLISHDAIAFERLGGLARALAAVGIEAWADGTGDGEHEAAADDGAALVVVTDARRREVYWSAYSGLDDDGLPVRAAAPGLAKPADLDEAIRASCGPVFVEAERTDPVTTTVSAAALGLLGETLFAHGRPFAADEPLYLRSPDVTVPGAPKRVS